MGGSLQQVKRAWCEGVKTSRAELSRFAESEQVENEDCAILEWVHDSYPRSHDGAASQYPSEYASGECEQVNEADEIRIGARN